MILLLIVVSLLEFFVVATTSPTINTGSVAPSIVSPTSFPSMPSTLAPSPGSMVPTTLSLAPSTGGSMVPTTLTLQPTILTVQPTPLPTTVSLAPSTLTLQPTILTVQPTPLPTTVSLAPSTLTVQPTPLPTTISLAPSTLTLQPTILTVQPTFQPTTISLAPSTLTLQPTILTIQPTFQPTSLSLQPSTLTIPPTTLSLQPSTLTIQPTIAPSRQPTTNAPQPTTPVPTRQPSLQPTTKAPQPTTSAPSPTNAPSPIPSPSTNAPSNAPSPIPPPTTNVPTPIPPPSTQAPSSEQPTLSPSLQPTTKAPSLQPTTSPSMASPSNTSTTFQAFSQTDPSTTIFATDNITVTLHRDDAYGPNGTVVVTTSGRTSLTLTNVVTIVFLDGSNREKNISNLTSPIVFTLPLLPGTSSSPIAVCLGELPVLITPQCTWFDTIDQVWTTTGCLTKLFATFVECSCTHLTDFAAVVPDYNEVPPQQVLSLTPANIAKNPDGLITIMIVLAIFIVILIVSIRKDKQERLKEGKRIEKREKWANDITRYTSLSSRKQCWKLYKAGLQTYHTWGSLLFRKYGTSFRSVDRVFVTLMMLLTLMSMSALFHARNHDPAHRGEIFVSSIVTSLVPALILTHLFTHTGEMGHFEKWQYENGIKKPSSLSCLRYRFTEKWRVVWYGVVTVCVLGMILNILGVALMFDQNPQYYCQGATTAAWLIDFIVPYLISTLVIEPIKVLVIVASKSAVRKAASYSNRKLEGSTEETDEVETTGGVQELPAVAR